MSNKKVKVWSMTEDKPLRRKDITTLIIVVPDEDAAEIIDKIRDHFNKRKL